MTKRALSPEEEAAYEDDCYYEDEFYDEGEDEQPRRGKILASALAIVVSLAVVVGGGYVVYTKVLDRAISFGAVADYEGDGSESVIVDIPSGSTLTQIGEILVDNDVVASRKAFQRATTANPQASSVQAGTYNLKRHMSAEAALDALLDLSNLVPQNQVTIREGLRNSEVVTVLSEGTGMAVESIEQALADTSVLGLPDWANGASEGFLFPNTYAYDDQTTPGDLFQQMVEQFNTVIADLDFVNKAEALGVTPYEALTIASIIEKETRDPQYGPDIAQVIYNRLHEGMRLQLDSTVIYAVNSPGTVTTTDEERANPSPYNTYMYAGLPPGAISNPGRSSLEAAVNPTQGDYLFFVAVNPETGETKFASDEDGHAANVAEFQQWCQANLDQCT